MNDTQRNIREAMGILQTMQVSGQNVDLVFMAKAFLQKAFEAAADPAPGERGEADEQHTA